MALLRLKDISPGDVVRMDHGDARTVLATGDAYPDRDVSLGRRQLVYLRGVAHPSDLDGQQLADADGYSDISNVAEVVGRNEPYAGETTLRCPHCGNEGSIDAGWYVTGGRGVFRHHCEECHGSGLRPPAGGEA